MLLRLTPAHLCWLLLIALFNLNCCYCRLQPQASRPIGHRGLHALAWQFSALSGFSAPYNSLLGVSQGYLGHKTRNSASQSTGQQYGGPPVSVSIPELLVDRGDRFGHFHGAKSLLSLRCTVLSDPWPFILSKNYLNPCSDHDDVFILSGANLLPSEVS